MKASGQVLTVLAVFMACHAGYQATTAAMLGINRHRGLIPIFLADATANVALSLFLVPRIGIIGSALGLLLPQLVVTLFVGPWYVRRELKVPLTDFWLRVHVRPVLSILPFAAISYLIERFWVASNLITYFGQVAVSLPFAAAGAWLLVLQPQERQAIATRLASLRWGRAAAEV
jgi:O-antigen/teichoic acid export membrane protein